MKQIQNLLFKKKEQAVANKLAKKIDAKYKEVKAEIAVGSKVKMKKNHQVGDVKEIRGKRAVVQIGLLPMSVELSDLVVVEEKLGTVKLFFFVSVFAIPNAAPAAAAPIIITLNPPVHGFTPVILLLKNPNTYKQISVIMTDIFNPCTNRLQKNKDLKEQVHQQYRTRQY